MGFVAATGEFVAIDAATMKALAHPVRLQLVAHLQNVGSGTATTCGAVVGLSPSACSYHLRVLAEVGLIEEAAEQVDGRTMTWQPSSRTIRFRPESEEAELAGVPVQQIMLDQAFDTARSFIAGVAGESADWRAAAGVSYWRFAASPVQVNAVREKIEQVISAAQADAELHPDPDARPVSFLVGAVPQPANGDEPRVGPSPDEQAG